MSALRGLPRRWLYPLGGILLAVGAPAGLVLLRALAGQLQDSSLARELSGDPLLYAYQFLATAAVLAGIGFALGRLEDRLEREAVTDALTGLGNRRTFERRLDEEVARSRRFATPLALVMLDIDGFKAINDRLGHREGDRLLARIGALIRSVSRAADIPCRYGGEEFAVVCPSTHAGDAAILAERLRAAAATAAARTGAAEEGPVAEVTLSAGVSELDRTAPDCRSRLIIAADRALYRAKAEGRDRVVCELPRESPGAGFAPARGGR